MSERRDDEAMRPVDEAGGGEAEGFEQAEADLIEHAEYTSGEGAPRLEELGSDEAEPDPATYGEADQEDMTDRD
jgi:hypothetical protein